MKLRRSYIYYLRRIAAHVDNTEAVSKGFLLQIIQHIGLKNC